MSPAADQIGGIVVYPQPTGHPTTWNLGAGMPDDIAFFSILVATLQQRLCIDASRVAATGISVGATMDFHLACSGVPWLSAIAPVAGPFPIHQPTCYYRHAISLLAFYGTADRYVPYSGAPGVLSIPQTIAYWAWINQCTTPTHAALALSDRIETDFPSCKSGATVHLTTIPNGGHTWPGAAANPRLGLTSRTVRASQLILAFVATHGIPAPTATPAAR